MYETGANQPAVLLGTMHVSRLLQCQPATLLDYERRGIASPLRGSGGTRLWRVEDLLAMHEHRLRHGLPRPRPLPADDE